MRLAVLDETDRVIIEYDFKVVRELLIKYTEVLKDVGKAFDQIGKDLMDKARGTQ